MKTTVASLRPAVLGIGLFLSVFAALAVVALGKTGGTLVYPTDDTYIQMALARTLGLHGTFGFRPDEPAFASSSPLWVFLLAPFAPLGLLDYAPALLNVVGGVLVIVTSLRFLAQSAMPPRALMATAIALNVLPPLAAVATIGLEHVLHAWLVVLFAVTLARLYGRAEEPAAPQLAGLAAVSFALVACRFEGLFLAGSGALLLLAHRRWTLALVLSAAAGLPVLLHAVAALASGWEALPTSVLLKGNYPAAESLRRLFYALSATPTVHLLVIANALALVGSRSQALQARAVSMLFLGTAALHMMFASIDSILGRYDAYLIVFGCVAAVPWLVEVEAQVRPRLLPTRAGAARVALLAAAVVAVLWPALNRAADVTRLSPIASQEVYLQQYQLAALTRAWPGESVVINDLGLVALVGSVRPVDFIGLGTIEFARLRRAGLTSSTRLDATARRAGAVAAIAYPHWLDVYGGGQPSSWIPVAELAMPATQTIGGPLVRLYAIDPTWVDRLQADARAWARTLPVGVTLTVLAAR